jgi:Tfp pilus assembly protein FimT
VSRSRLSGSAGYSLIELMVVVGTISLLGGAAVMQMGSLRTGLQGDGAMRVAMGALNLAREAAVARRRSVTVDFVGTNVIRTTVGEEVSEVAFESGVEFALVAGVGDTPDTFGRVSATTFGSVTRTSVVFNSEGSLVDGAGTPMNGTIFLAIPNTGLSARAVTVLGTTGRVRGYRWDGHAWVRT